MEGQDDIMNELQQQLNQHVQQAENLRKEIERFTKENKGLEDEKEKLKIKVESKLILLDMYTVEYLICIYLL